MDRQKFLIWTGGDPENSKGCEVLARALPIFPDPAPLRCTARIVYRWGAARFDSLATACSVRIAPWGEERITWLHCKAVQTKTIKADEAVGQISILIPAHYVTRFEPGPTFEVGRRRRSNDIGVFPPNQKAPINALPLAAIEHVLAELLVPDRN